MRKKGNSLQRKKTESPWQRPTTPAVISRGAIGAASDAKDGSGPDAVETPRNRQDKVSGAITAPREAEQKPETA